MSHFINIIIALLVALTLTACSPGKSDNDSDISSKPAETNTNSVAGSTSEAVERISFDIDDPREGSYTDHVKMLWDQTKMIMQADLDAKYTDDKYLELGESIEIAWTNLQVHSSLEHAEEVEAADENVAYANVIGKIKDLIWEAYGIPDRDTPEKRDEKRSKLRDGGLERRFEKIDEIVME